jgi:hypothetical protein
MKQSGHINSKDVIRRNSVLLPIFPDVLPHLISIQRFPHIERILAPTLVLSCRVVTVVVDDPAEDAVAHLAVHVDGKVVAGADVEVDEPGVSLVACALELFREEAGVAETAVLRGDGENSDVAVPGEGMGGGREVGRGGFKFAHYCSKKTKEGGVSRVTTMGRRVVDEEREGLG